MENISCKPILPQNITEKIENYKEQSSTSVAHRLEEAKQKAPFLMRIGQSMYSKCKTPVSPTPLTNPNLNAIVKNLAENYALIRLKFTEQFKVSTTTKVMKGSLTVWQNYANTRKHATLAVILTQLYAICSCVGSRTGKVLCVQKLQALE